jgi:hypothetical protein
MEQSILEEAGIERQHWTEEKPNQIIYSLNRVLLHLPF